MTIEKVRLDKIILDPELQFRSETTNEATVARYTEALEGGETLPPITAYRDDVDRVWVADGFNRHVAHRRAGREEIECDVRDGSRADALTEALKSNEKHGLPRDDEGRIKAMKTFFMLNENMRSVSTRQLLPYLGMSKRTADRIRKRVEDDLRAEGVGVPTTRVGSYGKERPVQSNRRTESTGAVTQLTTEPASVSVEESEPIPVGPIIARSSATGKPKADRRRDAEGVIVPDHLADIFGDESLPSVIEKIEAALKPVQVQGLLSSLYAKSQHLAYLDLTQVQDALGDGVGGILRAVQCLQSAMPHVVCKTCKGSGCDRCRHAGYLPQWQQEESQQFGEAA